MVKFSYAAVQRDGSPVSGLLDADDEAAALAQVRAAGQLPLKVTRVRPGQGRFLRRSVRRSDMDVILFTRELLLLMKAGQPLERALTLLAGGLAPRGLRSALDEVLAQVRAGIGLADALDKVGGFPRLFIAIVRSGESGGVLDLALGLAADLMERSRKLRDGLTSALAYPTILAFITVASVAMMLLHVVPMFEPMFARSLDQLPLPTRVVLAASAFARTEGDGVAVALSVLLLCCLWLGRQRFARVWWHGVVLRLPVAGPLVAMAATAQFARTLSVLLHAGMTLNLALPLAGRTLTNSRMQDAATSMHASVRDGRPLTAGLPPGHPIPDLAVQLIRVGEESGRLDDVLRHIAEMFETKVETGLKRLLTILEPACIVTMAAIIGGVVVSILLALVSINALAV